MANVLDVETVTVSIPAAEFTDNGIIHLLKAPSASAGGAIRILGASAVNNATTSGTVGFSVALLNYGTGGSAVSGTVAAAIGGTSSHWTSAVPKDFTLLDGQLDAGEWLVGKLSVSNAGSGTRFTVILQYLMGI